MLANFRSELTVPRLVERVGSSPEDLQAISAFSNVTREELLGNYEFEFFDGVSASEKQSRAQTLQEVLLGLAAQPESAMATGYSLGAILREILLLRGIRNPERFQQQQQQPQQQQPAPQPQQNALDFNTLLS